MVSWKRPDGPINVYNIINGHETLSNGMTKDVKISIQETPNEEMRREEVIDLMVNYYIKEEPTSKSLKISEDPQSIEDYKKYWYYSLDQRISVGAYVLDSDGSLIRLAGANLLYYIDDKTKKDFHELSMTLKSPRFLGTYNLMNEMLSEADVRKIYNVTKYLGSISLMVHPDFRGQKLGYHLLEARSKIGLKYGLMATSTNFTSIPAQKAAKLAGFEEALVKNYSEIIDNEGNLIFPDIDSPCTKLMIRKLP